MKATKAEQQKLREKHGFHRDYIFRSVPYMLFMKRNDFSVASAPAEFAKLSGAQKTGFTQESDKLRVHYDKQNKARVKRTFLKITFL